MSTPSAPPPPFSPEPQPTASPQPSPGSSGFASSAERRAFAAGLQALGAVKFGRFTLKDGSESPVYCDLRLLISDPDMLAAAGRVYARLLADLRYDRLAAVPTAGLPLGAAAALAARKPMLFPRLARKEHGTGRAIEGLFQPGETVVLLDDLISSGASKREAIDALEAAGLEVRDIVVLVDRRPLDRRGAFTPHGTERGTEAGDQTGSSAASYRVHAALGLEEIAAELEANKSISSTELSQLRRFMGAG